VDYRQGDRSRLTGGREIRRVHGIAVRQGDLTGHVPGQDAALGREQEQVDRRQAAHGPDDA
jgi:hypothetical protein